MKDFSRLEDILSIKFNNIDYLRQALVHRSYLNENPSFQLSHNERLEFLGDAVLELVVTEFLYEEYPDKPEGELTNWRASLVNSVMCSKLARELDLESFLYLSKGEAKDKNAKARGFILADALEAVIGAIYLDQGYSVAKKFIAKILFPQLPDILANQSFIDAKSKFQEIAQEKLKITPSYRVLDETGPDHAKIFTIGVYLDEDLVAQATGTSKQEAQTKAATAAIKKKKWVTK